MSAHCQLPRPRPPVHASATGRRRALGLAAALLCLPALPACAADAYPRAPLLDLSVVDRDTGQVLGVYRHEGRSFVAGQPGRRYALRLINRSPGRVLVVLSVDGVNVVSGETAALGQTGYVLDPWRSCDITGWRKSDTAVAAFEFAALADAYATRTGRPGNVGVIGAAVFAERPAPQAMLPLRPPLNLADAGRARAAAAPAAEASKSAAAPPPAAAAVDADAATGASIARRAAAAQLAQRSEKLGTAHGSQEWSVSQRTTFERQSSRPQQLVELAYDSLANLVAAGVIAVDPPQAQARAFPGDDRRGYVPDPPPR